MVLLIVVTFFDILGLIQIYYVLGLFKDKIAKKLFL